MAIALDWKAHVDTDLKFSEFFSKSHTLVARFMPQYPQAYEGPFIAENGTGTFGVGQGNFGNDETGSTKLYLAVGGKTITRAATLAANTWYHLAVVVKVSTTQRTFALYLDGAQLGGALNVPLTEPQMPVGTLRFGKRTTGQTVGESHDAQTYGLLDDIAIFTRALTASEISDLRTKVPHLTGTEADLLAGYTFAEGQLPATLARKTTLQGGARRVTTSPDRDSALDAKLLSLPAWHQPMDLPFPAGEAWKVIIGFEVPGGHHSGNAAFCWDFVLADQPDVVTADKVIIESGGEYPKGTGGAPLYAAAPGKVVTVVEGELDGTASNGTKPNILEIEQAPGEIAFYEHLRKNSVPVSVNDAVLLGQKIALAGASGMAPCNKCNHLHFTVTNLPDGTPGFITMPAAFSDYEARDPNGAWQSVARGIPTGGEVVRIPPAPTFGAHGLGVGNAIARGPNLLDVVATDTAGRVWVARWTPSRYARNWDRWRPVLADISAPNTPVGVVARDANRLDVFVAGSDGKTCTAAWDQNFAGGQWRGWWNILSGALPAGGAVTAVARGPGKMDVFMVSNDGGVYTAAWDQNVASGQWRGWWRIGTLAAKPGSRVAAVARDANKLDIFVAGSDGKTYTAAWDQNVAGGQWRGWWNILSGALPAGGAITAVARGPGKMDVFMVSNDGGVYTAAWDQNVASGQWRGWWRIGTLAAKPGSPVTAVARDADKLDIFVAGSDGRTYTAAWDQNVASGQWRGWWNILIGAISPGAPISAVSRDANKLDVFIVSTDGGVYTAAWDQNVASGQWRGWSRIGI